MKVKTRLNQWSRTGRTKHRPFYEILRHINVTDSLVLLFYYVFSCNLFVTLLYVFDRSTSNFTQLSLNFIGVFVLSIIGSIRESKTLVFCDLISCSLIDRYQCYRDLLLLSSGQKNIFYPEVGRSNFFWNVVYIYWTARSHIRKDDNVQSHYSHQNSPAIQMIIATSKQSLERTHVEPSHVLLVWLTAICLLSVLFHRSVISELFLVVLLGGILCVNEKTRQVSCWSPRCHGNRDSGNWSVYAYQ
jgi:hypothetical protein